MAATRKRTKIVRVNLDVHARLVERARWGHSLSDVVRDLLDAVPAKKERNA